ncbi:hypothetical protein [Streptomyces sp. NPDC008139]|uniref:hypothetical protein n=1 Tax=Streptomyces sp. NPDC008139 TaxID=3364814 RepID=UPI0036EE3036
MTELAAAWEERLGLLKRMAEAGPQGDAGEGPGVGTDAGTGTAAEAGPEPGGS